MTFLSVNQDRKWEKTNRKLFFRENELGNTSGNILKNSTKNQPAQIKERFFQKKNFFLEIFQTQNDVFLDKIFLYF